MMKEILWISGALVLPLMTYMLPVDEVEQMTHIDFFCQLPDSVQTSVEADYTVADWTVKQ